MSDDLQVIRDALAAAARPCPDGQPPVVDIEFVVACSPDRIARLLKRLEDAERDAARVRAAALEEAAQACENRYMGDNNREDAEARRCAAAIRQRSA